MRHNPVLSSVFAMFLLVLVGCSTSEPAEPASSEANRQPGEPEAEESSVVLDENCDALSENLASCARYRCQIIHPFDQKPIVREVVGLVGGKCRYAEQMPNNGKMECRYSKPMRMAVARYYARINGQRVDFSGRVDLESGKSTIEEKIGGVKIENPLQEAMDSGVCVVSGYK